MEVKIGVQYAARELVVETDESVDAIESAVSAAIAGETLLTLTDRKGKKIFVPASKITYVEISSATANAVGFRA
ncbi:DUF3107 domain-containing protein [Nocardioides sp. Kera G14]|uniref:DUF3107 domain-containing protein n=1 Tax=Nocardioides sp. Kera G14 TaxID=2884264 RepID=UPI001D117960|nr:DUF3107 domain-containing protein [Nocardioides sp. Kera G14]UDY24565.1 DUF3107 domain-containing protein [Nocardioides sp. Kera G14]